MLVQIFDECKQIITDKYNTENSRNKIRPTFEKAKMTPKVILAKMADSETSANDANSSPGTRLS